MPKIDVSLKDLLSLIGRDYSLGELENILMFAKAELDGLDGDSLKIDIKDSNRPDLWSTEGISREIRLRLGEKQKLDFKDSDVTVTADESLKKVRPFISCCYVTGLKFTDQMIKDLMAVQERFHARLGRNREMIAIGISNFDLIKPNILYKAATEDIKFPPLGHTKMMTPKEVLEKHDKGREYRHLVPKKIPILIDSKKQVISMPPIINSNNLGKIDEKTKNIFIDVTGTDENLVDFTLLLLAANFALRGGKVYRVKVKSGKSAKLTPQTEKITIKADPRKIREICGFNLEDKMILRLLEKTGCVCSIKSGRITAAYPAYRKDVFDERDLIEDVLISYGYNKLLPHKVEVATTGMESRQEKLIGVVDELMVGSGFQQAVSFILSNEEKENSKMRQNEKLCKITNPVNQNYTVVRRSLLPTLLEFLSRNQHNESPQKVFEAGKVIAEGSREKIFVSAVVSNSAVNYEEMSSVLEALVSGLGYNIKLEKAEDERFIEGRAAKVKVDGKAAGVIGEIHPIILENFSLEAPVVAFEIDLGFLPA